MAVREHDSASRVCEKCFANVAAGTDYCPECGAPLADEPYTEGSDGAIYPELARANLLRMRGDFKAAEEVCLSILRKFPNNATANGLLGDICAERGDLEHASQWYELALDVTPDASEIRQKLLSVTRRIKERDAAATAEQLGLPTSRPRVTLYIALVIVVLIVTGLIAYALGRRTLGDAQPPASAIVNAPVVLEPLQTPQEKQADPPQATQPNAPAPLGVPLGRSDDESQLLAAIASGSPEGGALVMLSQDPRTKAITLTIALGPQEDARGIAARLGASAFDKAPACDLVTVRALREGRLVLVADLHRQTVALARSPEWQSQHANDPAAFANAVLANLWEIGAPPASPTNDIRESPPR